MVFAEKSFFSKKMFKLNKDSKKSIQKGIFQETSSKTLTNEGNKKRIFSKKLKTPRARQSRARAAGAGAEGRPSERRSASRRWHRRALVLPPLLLLPQQWRRLRWVIRIGTTIPVVRFGHRRRWNQYRGHHCDCGRLTIMRRRSGGRSEDSSFKLLKS